MIAVKKGGKKTSVKRVSEKPVPFKDPQKHVEFTPLTPVGPTKQKLLDRIRLSLPGQASICFRERTLNAVQPEFGLAYTRRMLSEQITRTIPPAVRGWHRCSLVWKSLKEYEKPIPDAALLKYQAARESGYFKAFHVVDYKLVPTRYADPWLIGEVRNAKDAYIVLAFWDK